MSPALSIELERALDFALLTNRGGVQPWMRWEGWELHVGCDVCAGDCRSAPCWALEACHGYDNGCGCVECATRQLSAQAQFAAAAAAGLGGQVVVALRAELASVDAQIRPSDDRRAG